jgi:hypothetical protein
VIGRFALRNWIQVSRPSEIGALMIVSRIYPGVLAVSSAVHNASVCRSVLTCCVHLADDGPDIEDTKPRTRRAKGD